MYSNNFSDNYFMITYEKITLIIDYINFTVLFINTISLICFVWLTTNKSISGVMDAYRWYLLSQTISYSMFHFVFTAWQFSPLPSYTTNNGTTLYMFCASGLGRPKKSLSSWRLIVLGMRARHSNLESRPSTWISVIGCGSVTGSNSARN